jgi:hypothetical protein
MSEPAAARPSVSRGDVAAYLAALYADAPRGSFVELRYRTRSGMGRSFHPAADRDAIAAEIVARAPTGDVYVGVIPRRRRGGGRDDLVPEARVLWVDCDTPEAVAALRASSPPPSMAVASGTGENTHAYWRLSEPETLSTIEEGNRHLAALLGADPVCADAARILRPPSLNHKHQPPSAVRLELCSPEPRHRIAAVVGEPAVDRVARPDRGPVLALDDPLRRVSPAAYVERLAGVAVPRHRKIRCPFHDDRTPSLHVYEDADRGWYCFGCARGGSIYDFAAHVWGVETRGQAFNGLHDALCAVFGPEDLRLA